MQKAGVFYNKGMLTNITVLAMLLLIVLLGAFCGLLFWRLRQLQSRLEPALSDEFDKKTPDSSGNWDTDAQTPSEVDLASDLGESFDESFDEDFSEAAGEVLTEYPLLEPLRGSQTPRVSGAAFAARRNQLTSRPVVLGLISHKGGTGKTTTALELARSWAENGQRVLFVDADPAQAAAALLDIKAPPLGEFQPVAGLHYVHWQPDSWPQPARWPQAFLKGWDLVVVDTPSLQNALTVQLLPILDALLLTLTLEPACMRVLEQGAILLERKLDPLRQRLLGVIVTRYQPLSALQKSLYSTLQREYVGILLPDPIPEDSYVWHEALKPEERNPKSPAISAYQVLAARVHSQLKPLKGRAGGQA